jgi:hypothetical protein
MNNEGRREMMDKQKSQANRKKWQWPQFSLREALITFTFMACLYGVVAIRVGREEVLPTFFGSLVLIWGLICWRTVRLNPTYFSFFRKASSTTVVPDPTPQKSSDED